jgi:hypothetical protein
MRGNRPLLQASSKLAQPVEDAVRFRDIKRADSLYQRIARVNDIRRKLRHYKNDWTLRFHLIDND